MKKEAKATQGEFEAPSALSGDKPIEQPEDDLLGYASFAENLAQGIKGYRGTDSLVIGLHGEWGSGKSSVLNMVKEYIAVEQKPQDDQTKKKDEATKATLREKIYNALPWAKARQARAKKTDRKDTQQEGLKQQRIITMDFNPWWFSGQDNLVREFFIQMQAVLAEERKRQLKEQGWHSDSNGINDDDFGKLIRAIGAFVDGVSGGSGLFSGVASMLSEAFDLEGSKNLQSIKTKIKKILTKSGLRILIFVDDIDRLMPDELHQLFTVIKGLADFPNVTYLLALDREVVSQALGEGKGISGSDYLDKIIQVSISLPPIDIDALGEFLAKNLKVALPEFDSGLYRSKLDNLYKVGLVRFMNKPRDMVRLVNAFDVNYRKVKELVDPVDFLGMEALRLKFPVVYDYIRNHQNEFSFGLYFNRVQKHAIYHSSLARGPDGELDWIKFLKEEKVEFLEGLVAELFLNEEFALHPDAPSRAVWHPESFLIYFHLSPDPGHISAQDVDDILELVHSPDKFFNELASQKNKLIKNGKSRAHALLGYISTRFNEIDNRGSVESAISILMKKGDELLYHGFDNGNDSISDIIYSMARGFARLATIEPSVEDSWDGQSASSKRLFDLIKNSIEGGRSLALQLLLIDRDQGSGPPNMDADSIKCIWLDRAKLLMSEDVLDFVKHPMLEHIMRCRWQWGRDEEGENDLLAWCDQVLIREDELNGYEAVVNYIREERNVLIKDVERRRAG